MAHHSASAQSIMTQRRTTVVAAAEKAGLLLGERNAIGARLPGRLLKAAKDKAGLEGTTEVVEYALAKLALEDDFGPRLVARKGKARRDLDLEF
ncbi:MAG TPA: hypothetical protein VFC47_02335 [Caulobacteraceae bacterium]|nr:hypothetical protein [Caulobacteraceae bacterium]